MSKPYSMPRSLLISDEITAGTVKSIIDKIMEINYDDDFKEEDYKDWKREPIYLFLNTNGGSVYSAWALYDIIRQSKTPVYTVALGYCMSAGLQIFMAGEKRFVSEHATLMFHDISTWVAGKTEELKQDLNEMIRLSKMYCDVITNNSMVKQETLDDYINRKAEWYIPANEAIKLKIADEYYK